MSSYPASDPVSRHVRQSFENSILNDLPSAFFWSWTGDLKPIFVIFRLKLELPDGVQWLWSRCVWCPHHRMGPDHLIKRSKWRILILGLKAVSNLTVCINDLKLIRLSTVSVDSAPECGGQSEPVWLRAAPPHLLKQQLLRSDPTTHTSPYQHTYLPHTEPCVCFTAEGEYISPLNVARVSDYNSPPVKKCVLHKVVSITPTYTDAHVYILASPYMLRAQQWWRFLSQWLEFILICSLEWFVQWFVQWPLLPIASVCQYVMTVNFECYVPTGKSWPNG